MPVHEMYGKGVEFLRFNFEIFKKQTFKDFDVVISDDSDSDVMKKLCEEYEGALDIKYVKNPGPKGIAGNTNNAIINGTGKLLKILYLDDFLYSDNSLQRIAETFDINKDLWLVTATICSEDGTSYFRPFFPKYTDDVHLGNNQISCPSVLTIKNDNPLLFDTNYPNFRWLVDCDYYKRLHDKFGDPKILNEINVVNRIGLHQTTLSEINEKLINGEYEYVVKKYYKGFMVFWLLFVRKIKTLIKKIR